MQAIPSPRPIQPMPSFVVALTLTRADVASARRRSISARSGPSRGSSQTRVASMLTIGPLEHADHGAQHVDRVGVAPALLVVGEERADVTACRRPRAGRRSPHGSGHRRRSGRRDRARARPRPRRGSAAGPRRSGGCRSRSRRHARFSPTPAPSGSNRRSRCSKTQISPTPSPPRNSTALVIPEPDLLGQVGVGGEGEGGAGLDAHLGEGRRRVELADRLAQPGGRDLDRDPALGDRLDRGLVVGARVALGKRPAPPQTLTRSGWARMSNRPERAPSASASK